MEVTYMSKLSESSKSACLSAEEILSILMSASFEDFHDGDFMDYVTGETKDKEAILNRISEIFDLG